MKPRSAAPSEGDASRDAIPKAGDSPAAWPPRGRGSGGLGFLLVLVAAGIQLAMLPAALYPGDNAAPRAEAVSWLRTGRFGIPFSARDELGQMVERRGQFVYENEARQRFFSRYGFGHVLLHVPPVWLTRLADGPEAGDLLLPGPSFPFLLMLYHVLFKMVAVGYLYAALRRLARPVAAAVAALLLAYATYLWHYLWAPALEVQQIPVFLGFVFHTLAFLERAADTPLDTLPRAAWRHLTAAAVWAGILVTLKLLYAIGFVALGLALLAAGPSGAGFRERLRRILRAWRPLLLRLGLPVAGFVLLVTLVHLHRFGGILRTGYDQWLLEDGTRADAFSPRHLPAAWAYFLARPGNGNIWLHMPVLPFALIGWPALIRRHRVAATFLGSFALLLFLAVSAYSQYPGEWCYGPRLILPALLAASLPLAILLDRVFARPRELRSLGLAAVLAAVALASVRAQRTVNRLHYFAYQYTEALFRPLGRPEIDAWFDAIPHRAAAHRAFLRLAEGDEAAFPPLQIVREKVRPEYRDDVLELMENHFRLFTQPNRFAWR